MGCEVGEVELFDGKDTAKLLVNDKSAEVCEVVHSGNGSSGQTKQ